MSRAQIDACAARMPPDQAATFRAQMSAADALFFQSIQLRRRAWALYRAATGLTPRGKPRRATR